MRLQLACLLALAAAPVSAQSFDSEGEAWAVAGRNLVTTAEWDIVSFDSETAAFIKRDPVLLGARPRSWAAFFETSDMSVNFILVEADCASTMWQGLTFNQRNFYGEQMSSETGDQMKYAAPGSVADIFVKRMCVAAP